MTMQAPAAPAPAAAPTPAAPPTAPERSTADARADALRAKLDDAPEHVEAGEATTEAPATQAAPAAGDAAAKARAERRARIEQVRAKERADDAERQKHAQRSQQERATTTELDSLRAKLKELEPLNDSFKSKDSFLAEAERRGFTPKEMIDYWREKLTDPQAIAARQAQTVEQKLLAEIATLRKQIEDGEQKRVQETEQQKAQREAYEGADQFSVQTQKMADSHPLAAQFLARHGQKGYIAFINHSIVPLFPNGYTLEELHDHVEEYLDRVQLGGASPTPATPANGTSQAPPKNGAEQPPTTFGHGHGSERTTVQEEVSLRSMTLEQRAERLKAQLGSE